MTRLRSLLTGLAALALATAGVTTYVVNADTGDGGIATTASASSKLPNRWYAAAPYLMPLSNNPPDAKTIMDASGLKAFQLAFILAGNGCTPTWDGAMSLESDNAIGEIIYGLRVKGGDVSVSFGGYGGTKLGETCATPEATAAAYQKVVSRYGLHAVDFDLEEPEYENAKAIHNEIGAAKILQRNNPGLYISVTTAATPTGTGWFGQQMLNEAKKQGFTPDNFSIMPFDGGFNGASAQTAALTAFNGVLRKTFGWDEATAYAHEGFSGMNGRSDSGEMFPQSAFRTVLDFAKSHKMARYTFWSLNRDRPCNPPSGETTSGVCSSVPQKDWEFAKYSVEFANGVRTNQHPVKPKKPLAPLEPKKTGKPKNPPASDSCKAPAWNSGIAYTGGKSVTYGGHTWHAKWWSQNEVPGTTGPWGPWEDQGPCK
ncbi:chitinase [Streptomyces sp. NPDC050560]|uniref:chitinase n=1 Tax=Streptomyces sp. NPDC050560 TaxID=3365630 RepID=UPI0037AAEFDB